MSKRKTNEVPREMSRASFTLIYDGPALQGGTMDVRDLAPSLLALGKLVETAARRVNSDRVRAQVNVSAEVTRGSFHIELQAAQFWEQVKALALGEDVKAAGIILGFLFGSQSVWSVIKWLRGRKPESVEKLPTGDVKITIDQSVQIVNGDVWNLYEDAEIRAESRKALRPLDRDGIDLVRVSAPDHTELRVEKIDLPAFGELPEVEITQAMEGETEKTVAVVKPSFESDLKWMVIDDDRVIGAYLKDEEFLAQIDRHEIRFGKGDRLRVRLHWKARDVGGDLQLTYTIREVLDFIQVRPARRLPLD